MKLKQIRVDGYKNLINCEVNLGDFNVIVGPNNSGKSNLLEVLQILFLFCFSGEETRKIAFKGYPFRRFGTSICYLKGHENKPLTMGITFETDINKKTWIVDYDVKIHRDRKDNGNAKFLTETLQAKQRSKTGKLKSGPATTYISRDNDKFKVMGKRERNIAGDNSSLLAIKSIYPNFEGLLPELKSFVEGISDIALTIVFAISPTGLRESIGEEKKFYGSRVSSFDLLLAIDGIYDDKKSYGLFQQTICDILDLDDLEFVRQKVPVPSKKGKEKETSEYTRFCFVKRRGNEPAHIGEYSDGTLAVAAILALLFSKTFVGPILFIEELENCLHPAAIEKLLRFLQDHADKWPVLMTTHSPYLLNGVKPEDVNVAIVDETGATHFEKVKNSVDLRRCLNKGLISFGDLLTKDFEGFREG